MKKMIAKLGGILVPIIFCIALIYTATMSLNLTDDLQGNARVINYIGIVRGATPVSYTHLAASAAAWQSMAE